MKSYGQFCPVAKASEVVAERWTPLVLRELFSGSVRFNDLRRGVPLISPTLLSRRLKELEQAGVVECSRGPDRRSSEYRLTEAGLELWPVIEALGVWGKRWTQARIEQRDLDAGVLMWGLRGSLRCERLPRRRTVLKFELAGTSSGKRLWWLVAEHGEVELCLLDPGFEVDLHVRTHIRTLTAVVLGDLGCDQVVRSGDVALEGAPGLVRAFSGLFVPSPLAKIERRV